MSLAEQIQRVDGGQNDTLKAILTALGVTVSNQKIDQLAALAATISPKLKPDNLNSAETNALYGLGADAVPDDVLAKISAALDEANGKIDSQVKIVSAKTTGNSITFESAPSYVIASFTKSSSVPGSLVLFPGEKIEMGSYSYVYLELNGNVVKVTTASSSTASGLRAIAFYEQ